MGNTENLRKCRYAQCHHKNTYIDIENEEYKLCGKMYYHTDCYKLKKKGAWKDEQTKEDLQYIKEGWLLHISKTVVYSELFRCLNDLVSRGISSEYLVFVFDYIVKNKKNLRHPQGFKYYVDKQEIKDAYNKHQMVKSGIKKQSDFVVTDDSSNAPKFTVTQKPVGFKSILGGKK